jgi:predicted aldo/keto reductase-like oxidoreductase
MTVMIMEPLLGGKLANSLPTKAVEIFKENNNKLTPAAWALNWLWNQKEITVVLSGMNSLEQLVENIKTATNSKIDMLSSDEKETINRVIEVLNEAYKIPCTSCNYCMPCPRDVNIPAAFSSYNTIFALGRVEGMKQYTMSIAVTSGKKVSISNCTNCGFCEKKCPQKIKVTKELKIVKRKLEPFWLSPFMAIARARFKNKN